MMLHIPFSSSLLALGLIATLLFTACHTTHPTVSISEAVQGELDLRGLDLSRGNVDLDGTWEFYWQQLLQPGDSIANPSAYISVPSVWDGVLVNGQPASGQGYATYRLRVLLDTTNTLLAIQTGNVSTSLTLLVNDQTLYQAGVVGSDKASTTPQYASGYAIFRPDSDTLLFTIQVANFYNREGGLWRTLTLGTEQNIRRAWRNDIVTDFFLIGSVLIIALYHIILFFFRQQDRSPLYFSLFCLVIVIRIATVDNYVINFFFPVPWAWLVRLEYLSFYLAPPLFVGYFYHLFPSLVPMWFMRSLWLLASLLSFAALVLSPRWFTYTTVFYQGMIALAALYTLFLIVLADIRLLPGRRAFALGLVVLFLAFLHDVLVANEIVRSVFLFSFGLLLFIFFQTFVLSKRFSLAFNAVEDANRALSYKNDIINERNEELRQLNNELDVFVYRTSHDLRAPISSVLGLVNIMRLEEDTHQFDQYLDLQEKSLLKLDGFIQDILNYSRNSRLEITHEAIDFHQLLTEVFALHSHLPNFVRVEHSVEVHQPEVFMTDANRLTTVLNNLISNAIRYCNTHHDISYVNVVVDANASFAQITVTDNGVGIAPEHIDKVFNMFYRATIDAKGSGLGLFIAKEMVQKLQGTIQVESQLYQGTTFVLTIPNLRTIG